jgi:hypothetical protein
MNAAAETPALSRAKLASLLGGALGLAVLTLVLFVLPAEFRMDPTGFGKLTGLEKLAAPPPPTVVAPAPASASASAQFSATPYRTDSIDIPLAANDDELEYKVRMKRGDAITYSWTADGIDDPDLFYFDFHGELHPAPAGAPQTIAEYAQQTGLHSSGSLRAPFDGVHGWYLQNQSEKPVVVHLKVSGFYELVPPGDYGNERGIEAGAPASK